MTTPIYVDHADLSSFTDAVNTNAPSTPASTLGQRFWSTPPRAASDPTSDVVEYTLASPRLVNRISFELARYPHTWALEYFDGQGWTPVLGPTRAPVGSAVLSSVPAVLPKLTDISGHLHPQHSYQGHWEVVELTLRPVVASRFRLVLTRTTAAQGPRDLFGNAVAYSLAVANVNFGYTVDSLAAVPRQARLSATAHGSFASADDILGSTVNFSLRQLSADLIADNNSNDADVIWRSEAQPYPDAVVCLYADLRDDDGQPQVFDRIYLDPLYQGPHVTVYYCQDQPEADFDGVAEPLTVDQARPTQDIVVSADMVDFGADGTSNFIEIDNHFLRYDPSAPWWLGLSFRSPLTSYQLDGDGNPLVDADGNTVFADLPEHVLFDAGSWHLSVAGAGLRLVVGDPVTGDTLDIALQFTGGQQITALVAYDGTGYVLHGVTSEDDQLALGPATAPIPGGDQPKLYLGSDTPVDTLITLSDGSSATVSEPTSFGCIQLTALVLKAEELPDEQFLTNPGLYSQVARFAADELPQARNALLRLAPELADPGHPTGLVGGPASLYESLAWTPIARDYVMLRGYLYTPPTKARFVKLEITNLHAEYRDIYQPLSMTAKKFPAAVIDAYLASRETGADPAYDDGLPLQMQAPEVPLYLDSPLTTSTGGTTSGISNTEVHVASDFATAERLHASRGSAWNYRAWHIGHSAPRFDVTGVHTYSSETVRSTLKIVYYAGLRRLAFARLAGSGIEDSEQYDDAFLDTANLRSASWVYDEAHQALTSGDATKAVAQSITFNSQRQVRGVQFATQQSQPHQLLPDPEFQDPIVANWRTVGDAKIPSEVPVKSDLLGTLLPVSRDSAISRWADIAPVYPSWGDATTAGVDYADLSHSTDPVTQVAGITSLPVPQPPGGRLYAAARVISQDDLNSPLYVQIVDATDPSKVLAEEQIEVKANQVTEWYCSYAVGDGGVTIDDHTWDDLVGGGSVSRPSLNDTFTRANANALGRMDSGQFWTGVSPLHIVSNTAQVTASGQESFFDPASDWGTWTLTFGNSVTTTTTGSSVPMVNLGSLHLMNDGRVLDDSTGAVLASLARPALGDVWTFQYTPTRYLDPSLIPSGVDPTVKEWSLTITINGGSPTTLSRASGYSRTKSILGAVGQTYAASAWTPSYQSLVTGAEVFGLPMPTDGAYDSVNPALWRTGAGESWTVSEPYAFTVGAASADYARSAAASWSTGDLVGRIGHEFSGPGYGTFEFLVTQLAATVSTSTYWLAGLDVNLALRADGALVRKSGGTVVASGVCPGITTGSRIAVKYAYAQQLSPTFRSTWSIQPTDTQALVFLRDGTVVGVYSAATVWSGGLREVYGFTDGTHYTITTGYTWTPDISGLLPDVRAVTWSQLDQGETITWDQVGDTTALNTDPVLVRVVQKNAARNTFFVDTVSLFHDPIVWEWSNDGGKSFVPGFGVRNDPDGVVLFPPPNPDDPAPVQNKLVYRLSGYAPSTWVAHLTIRPWYEGYARGVPARPQGSYAGPNIDPWEDYPPIERDPRFQLWHRPVPRQWWFAFRQLDPDDEPNPFIAPVLTDSVVIM